MAKKLNKPHSFTKVRHSLLAMHRLWWKHQKELLLLGLAGRMKSIQT
jgi:hypothetical protein